AQRAARREAWRVLKRGAGRRRTSASPPDRARGPGAAGAARRSTRPRRADRGGVRGREGADPAPAVERLDIGLPAEPLRREVAPDRRQVVGADPGGEGDRERDRAADPDGERAGGQARLGGADAAGGGDQAREARRGRGDQQERGKAGATPTGRRG